MTCQGNLVHQCFLKVGKDLANNMVLANSCVINLASSVCLRSLERKQKAARPAVWGERLQEQQLAPESKKGRVG